MQKQTWDDFGDILTALDATWPAAARQTMGPWIIRDGQGGGKRVSAATPQSDWTPADIQTAEVAMQDLGQTPLFMITDQDHDLDQALATAGYDIVDPVNIYSTSVETLTTERPPKVSMFSVWPPLAIEIDMWAEGGISDARVNVMKRVQGRKHPFWRAGMIIPRGWALRPFMAKMPLFTRWKYAPINANRVWPVG